MAKLIDLIFSTNTVRKRQYSTGKVGEIDVSHNKRANQLIIKAKARPSERGKPPYKLNITFNGITSSDIEDKINKFPYSSKDTGVQYFVRQPTVQDKVQVRCTCKDFYFMWSWWDKKEKSLVGPHKKYIRVTPPSGRPPVNPEEAPGLCKHLLNLTKILFDNNAIKPNTKAQQYLNRKIRKQ